MSESFEDRFKEAVVDYLNRTIRRSPVAKLVAYRQETNYGAIYSDVTWDDGYTVVHFTYEDIRGRRHNHTFSGDMGELIRELA